MTFPFLIPLIAFETFYRSMFMDHMEATPIDCLRKKAKKKKEVEEEGGRRKGKERKKGAGWV